MTGIWDRIRNILAAVGAALLALFAGIAIGRRANRPFGREVDKQLQRTEDAAARAGDVAADERAKQEVRRQRARDLDERLRRLPGGPLSIILLAVSLTLFSPTVMAEAPSPPPAVNLPGDYESLVDLYLEAVSLAAQYRELYQQAEESNARLIAELEALRAEVQRLTQVVERQQQLIERQQRTILDLLRGVKVSVGLGVKGLQPLAMAPWVAVSYEF